MSGKEIQKVTTLGNNAELVIPSSTNAMVPDSLKGDLELADELKQRALAENTKTAYLSDWKRFVAYCGEKGVSPLPALPETFKAYSSSMFRQGCKWSTISRFQVVIRHIYRLEGHPNPFDDNDLWLTLKGIHNTLGMNSE